jgi:hypothetical protein
MPRWGGYGTLKLCQSSTEIGAISRVELALLESQSQLGSAAKAAFTLVRFCPNFSMAPVLAIMYMVAGVVLKRRAARPRWGV